MNPLDQFTTPELIEALKAFDDPKALPQQERTRYRDAGWLVIDPGTPSGVRMEFKTRDWHESSFLAVSGTVVEVPLLWAKQPHSGAFRRLRRALESKGWRVRIVAPMGQFAEFLSREGYWVDQQGTTFTDRRDVWRRPFDRPHEAEAAATESEREAT